MVYKYEDMKDAIDDDVENWKQTIEAYIEEDNLDEHIDRIVKHLIMFAWQNSEKREEIKQYTSKKVEEAKKEIIDGNYELAEEAE